MTRILFGWLDKLPSWLRAGVTTAWFTFLALFGLSVLDVLADLLAWASAEDAPFPDLSVLGKALVTATASAAAGIVNAVVRFAQERIGRGNPPIYPSQVRAGDRGQTVGLVPVLLLAILVVLLIIAF